MLSLYSHSKQTICNNSGAYLLFGYAPFFLKKTMTKATDIQVGGDHYKLPIQPIEYIWKNKIDFLSGNIIKYASRHSRKNKDEDVLKIIHYAMLILELEYGYDKEKIKNIFI